jgi:hypothetical protein
MKKIIFLLFMLVPCITFSQIVTWQGPEGFASEKYYQVKVNGQTIPVYDTPIASYAAFDFTGKVTVEITTIFDVRWVDIRPWRKPKSVYKTRKI